jgi:hypothetical protein
VYHLAGVLSAAGEADRGRCWAVNVDSLRLLLELAALHRFRLFWASSIAVFGPSTPRTAPQEGPFAPASLYGVAKVCSPRFVRSFSLFPVKVTFDDRVLLLDCIAICRCFLLARLRCAFLCSLFCCPAPLPEPSVQVAGELLLGYYAARLGVDARALRFPGLVSSAAEPVRRSSLSCLCSFVFVIHDSSSSLIRIHSRILALFIYISSLLFLRHSSSSSLSFASRIHSRIRAALLIHSPAPAGRRDDRLLVRLFCRGGSERPLLLLRAARHEPAPHVHGRRPQVPSCSCLLPC